MKKLGSNWKWAIFALSALALVIGLTTLSGSPAQAAPQPDCGPTRQWTCAIPGCPECYEVLFEGTVCEKNTFEAKSGRVCTPS